MGLEVVAGFDKVWTSQLLNDGSPVAYPSNATFDAAVWPGAALGTLFSPTAAWVDSTLGTFTLTIAGTQTTGLDPGIYRIQVGVTNPSTGLRSVAYNGTLTILEAPGSATLRTPYALFQDMVQYFDQVETLANDAEDTTGFLSVLCLMSDQLDRDIINRYVGRTTFPKVRQLTRDAILGDYDVPSATATAPSRTDLTAALKANGLIVDPVAREIVARRSIATILDRQEVKPANPYDEEAMRMRARADELWQRYEAQVSIADPPTTTATHIFRPDDVVILGEGTVP